MLATIRKAMGSSLKEELGLFKREIREEVKRNTKTDEILNKKAAPTPLFKHFLFIEKVNGENVTTRHGRRESKTSLLKYLNQFQLQKQL